MTSTVVIDSFPSARTAHEHGAAVVAIDVIRATTTAVTAVAAGRRCFPVPSVDAALRLRAAFADAVLAGEERGRKPRGFAINNSPAAVAARMDVGRPLILLSSSGTKLMHALRASPAAYVACFRNATAVTRHLVGRHRRVVLVGATSRGEFREEDQMCSAWIAASLIEAGYRAQDRRTAEIVERWGSASPDACARGRSAGYLRRTDQLDDLEFILTHVDDVDAVFAIEGDEVVARPDHARWPGLPAASVVGRP